MFVFVESFGIGKRRFGLGAEILEVGLFLGRGGGSFDIFIVRYLNGVSFDIYKVRRFVIEI